MSGLGHRIAVDYERHILNAGKEPEFFILLSFLITFSLVRAITHAIRSGRAPFLRNVERGGVHIHHLVWGILLLLITGFLALALDDRAARLPLALLYGAGAALTLDEFALWLNLADVYWSRQGRRSIDAVVIFGAVVALTLLGLPFWIAAGRDLGRVVGLL